MPKRLLAASILLVLLGPSAKAQPASDPTQMNTEIGPDSFSRWRPEAVDAAKFKQALAAYSSGAIEAGDAIAMTQTDPVIRTALEWAAIRNGRSTLGTKRLIAFTKDNPDFPMNGWIRRRAESAMFEQKPDIDLVRSFFAHDRPETAAGKYLLASVLQQDGKIQEAKLLLRDAWRDNTLPKSVETAILKQFPNAITREDYFFRAERLVFRQQMSEAIRVGQIGGDGYIALLKALRASLVEAGDAARLQDAVPAAFRTRASFLFLQAQQLRRAGKLQEAAKAMLSSPRHENSIVSGEDWWTERRLLSRKLLDQGDAKTAYAVASGYNATKDGTRIEAEFHAGWIALRFLTDPEAAAVHFSRAGSFAKTPLSLSRSYYWLGRAREAEGQPAREAYERAAYYGATFYGQLASDRLGRSELHLRSIVTSEADRLTFDQRQGARVIRLLLDNGARDLALPLAVDFAQTLTNIGDANALGELLAEYRDSNLALTVAKIGSQHGLPMDRFAFPLFGLPAYEPVEGSADKALVYAIARQESAFNAKAVSHAGARGLMQMMPATAAATARQFGLAFKVGQLTGDPQANARLGAAHLGHLMQTHRGSYVLVFAGYNAGPGRVREWIAAYGDPRDAGVDMIDWIERIPISETRNYVQRVMENVQVYRQLMTGDRRLLVKSDLERGARPAVFDPDPIATGSIKRASISAVSGR